MSNQGFDSDNNISLRATSQEEKNYNTDDNSRDALNDLVYIPITYAWSKRNEKKGRGKVDNLRACIPSSSSQMNFNQTDYIDRSTQLKRPQSAPLSYIDRKKDYLFRKLNSDLKCLSMNIEPDTLLEITESHHALSKKERKKAKEEENKEIEKDTETEKKKLIRSTSAHKIKKKNEKIESSYPKSVPKKMKQMVPFLSSSSSSLPIVVDQIPRRKTCVDGVIFTYDRDGRFCTVEQAARIAKEKTIKRLYDIKIQKMKFLDATNTTSNTYNSNTNGNIDMKNINYNSGLYKKTKMWSDLQMFRNQEVGKICYCYLLIV